MDRVDSFGRLARRLRGFEVIDDADSLDDQDLVLGFNIPFHLGG